MYSFNRFLMNITIFMTLSLSCFGLPSYASEERYYIPLEKPTYMLASSRLLIGTVWEEVEVEGVLAMRDDIVLYVYDHLPYEYPEEWIEFHPNGFCRAYHKDLPPEFHFTYSVNGRMKYYKTNTDTRRKSYLKFRCAKSWD